MASGYARLCVGRKAAPTCRRPCRVPDHVDRWSRRDREGGAKGAQDVVGSVDDIGGGELQNGLAELLEGISAAGVALSISVRDMTEPARNLYDEMVSREVEVDAGDPIGATPEDHLALWSRNVCGADKTKESTFEVRLAARVEQQFAKEGRSWTTSSREIRQPTAQLRESGHPQSDRAIDDGLQFAG